MTREAVFQTSSLPEVTSHDRADEAPLDVVVQQHARHARKLQSEAVARSVTGMPGALRAGWLWWMRRQREAETRRRLNACSDWMLADIGVAREHIDLAAKGVDVGDPSAVLLHQQGWWQRMKAAFAELRPLEPKQRRVFAELSAYSEQDLQDIGIRRADIRAIARAA